MEWRRDGFCISPDPDLLGRSALPAFFPESYWAVGIPRAVVDRSIQSSLAFGVYEGQRQVGFARVITDRATFAYVADVFIHPSHRGRGLAKWLMEIIRGHPDLQGLRRWMLITRDAHALYRKIGFREVEDASRYMEIVDRGVYARP